MILKLFIIPWIWARAQNVQSNPAAVAPPPTAPNAQFVDIPFYQFLQRQNQINNAILLNNAMLANSLTAIPPNEHQMQIANTLQFPNAAVALPANHAALFPNFQPKLAAVPTAGLNRLGIYDVLNRPVKFEPMSNMLVPAQVSSSTTTQAPPIKKTTVLPESEGSNKEEIQEPDPIPIGVSEPDDITKKVIDLSVASRQKATTRTTEIPSLTELIEEIGEENLITTTTEKAIDVISTKKPKPDVYNILKTLNLTDEETNDLVSHVEKVVREELVRKLSEARIIDRTTTTERLATTVPSTEAVTTVAESEEFEEPIKVPLRRTKPEKELLFYIPQKKPKAEIKHHPQRLSAEERPEFVEAEILTSQMHLPIQEKIEDEKNDEDAAETTVQKSSSTLVPTIHQKIHVRELNITVDSPKSNFQSYAGVDADLLNIGIATGAPLDLDSEGSRVVSYRTRNSNRATSTTQSPPSFQPVVGRPKTTSHPKTPFERLAVDYKERLTGAGDMDKFLKTIYSNAYIALVDAKEASSVRIPLIMRRAQAEFG